MNISSAPLCKFSASRTISCAMKLDIIPWCLFINGLGYDIKVVDLSKNQECSIQSNRIAIPMTITVYFPFSF